MRAREPWKPRILRRSGRLLATAFALVYGVLVIGEGFDQLNVNVAVFIALIVCAALAALASWVSDRVGGAMLVVASVALASFFVVAADRDQVTGAAVIAGPFFAAGLALLLAAGLHEEWLEGRGETDGKQ